MLGWLVLSAIVIVLDLYTKYLASTHLTYASPVPVIDGFFNFTLLHNTGAAFSFLASESGWQRWFFVILATGVSVFLVHWMSTLKNDRWLAIALALVLGGAIGNLYDRMMLGYVVDFLHFYWQDWHFPAFNIADSAITVGAAMMILDMFRHKDEDDADQLRDDDKASA